MSYFSQREYAAFLATLTGQAKISWLALSGKTLSEQETRELEALLDEFFRKRNHRSFKLHA